MNLTGSIGLEALNLPDILSGATVSRSVLGSLAATIFDAGKLRQNVKIASAQQEQALLAYQSTILTALEEVENALVSYQRLSERKAALQRAANNADSADSLAQNQYRAGTSIIKAFSKPSVRAYPLKTRSLLPIPLTIPP